MKTWPVLVILSLLGLSARADEPRHQIEGGYGLMSTYWLAREVGGTLWDTFCSCDDKHSSATSGVRQLGYAFRFSDRWAVQVLSTRERFKGDGEIEARLLGFRKTDRRSPGLSSYWGIAAGKSEFTNYRDGLVDEYFAMQLEVGLRMERGPVYAYGELGLGDGGGVGVGVGVQF